MSKKSDEPRVVQLIGEIVEQGFDLDAAPPSLPQLHRSVDGFPRPRKRLPGPRPCRTFPDTASNTAETPAARLPDPSLPSGQAVRSGRTPAPTVLRSAAALTQAPVKSSSGARSSVDPVNDETEKRKISAENEMKLASLSPEEIEAERAELLQSLDPNLLQQFLKRSSVGDRSSPPDTVVGDQATPMGISKSDELSAGVSNVPSLHFAAPQDPIARLDPSDPDFLASLHKKYFPNLSAEPEKLEWMRPLSSEETSASGSIPSIPSAIRFDFRGQIIPPHLSSSLPVTKGLHHHGASPQTAGYAIPELSYLARSSFPSQRAIAFQTLGRILYRLGRGKDGGYERLSAETVLGLWQCIDEGRVLETLMEATHQERGHLTAKAVAVEAVWLWQQGGGKMPRHVGESALHPQVAPG